MKNRKKILFIIIGLLLIGGVSLGFYLLKSDKTSNVSTQDSPINLEPPTQEDVQRAEANKKAIEQRDAKVENLPQSSGSNKTVKPIITYAGQYGPQVEVGAYINDVYEDGGTCTAEFTKDGYKFTKQVQAVKSAKSTDCPAIIVSTQDFPQKGSWNLSVSYKSSSASGISDSRDIGVN